MAKGWFKLHDRGLSLRGIVWRLKRGGDQEACQENVRQSGVSPPLHGFSIRGDFSAEQTPFGGQAPVLH